MLDEERKVHYIGNLDDYDASFSSISGLISFKDDKVYWHG